MSKNQVERLNDALAQQLAIPWTDDKSGAERVWFLVFEPTMLRRVDARKDLFRQTVVGAGKHWTEIDLSLEFGDWMANHRYAERYFSRPQLARNLADTFAEDLAAKIVERIVGLSDDSLIALTGTEAVYGLVRLSHLIHLIEDKIPGRLLVFFPGSYAQPNYQFLNAREGWNYLAVPILAGTV